MRRIANQGHEVASHGYGHERASDLSEAAFSADIQRSKGLLENLCGMEISGYRAPSFSIGPANLWAFDSLARAGYRYSSSIYPIRHDHCGMPDAPRFTHQATDGLIEIPITTLRLFKRNLPSSGGGYFRLLPYALSRWMLRRVDATDKQAAIFYFHPREIDSAQPRIAGIDRKTRFRRYLNIHKMEDRLQNLLDDFHWGRMDRVFLPARLGLAQAAGRETKVACLQPKVRSALNQPRHGVAAPPAPAHATTLRFRPSPGRHR